RTTCDFIDRAGERVAARQRSLRPAENLDAIEVEGGAAGGDRERLVKTVIVIRDRRVGALRVRLPSHTAQEHAVEGGLIGETRREVGHVLDRLDADRVALLAGEGRNGDGNRLKVLRALFRGHNDRFDRSKSGRYEAGCQK